MLPDSPHKSRHPALPDLKVHKLLRRVKSIGTGINNKFFVIEHLCLEAKTPANTGSRPCRCSSYGCENKNALRERKILSSRPRWGRFKFPDRPNTTSVNTAIMEIQRGDFSRIPKAIAVIIANIFYLQWVYKVLLRPYSLTGWRVWQRTVPHLCLWMAEPRWDAPQAQT